VPSHLPLQLRTRAQTLSRAVCTAHELFAAGQRLLAPELPCELRLLGLRVSSFLEAPRRDPGQVGTGRWERSQGRCGPASCGQAA
jgi:hypothetical protein